MNKRIKELAEQAGFVVGMSVNADRQIKRFAELVRQDERQALAQPEQPMSPEHLPQYIATNNLKPMEGGGGGGSQPKREWVGLTDEEIVQALGKANLPTQFSYRMAGKAIETKLKEKNT